ncbi:MAG: DUF4209 domain-containing protein [Phycisphaerae bacterium]|nr:DUF4209 domain-containing protein [Phycisphaerae bacterium]
MNIDECQLDEVLDRFDGQTAPFDEVEITEAIQTLAHARGDVQKLSEHELAEGMAFSFATTCPEEPSPWGTYYGPKNEWQTKSGERVERPSIKSVSESMLKYWECRLEKAKHPRLRARYADLIFDFTEKITGKKPDYQLAHVVIDETVQLVEERLFHFMSDVRVKLTRALDLAVRLNDQERIKRVCDAIIACEEKSLDNDGDAARGLAFDLLVEGDHKVKLSEQQEAGVIAGLEKHLVCVATGEPPKFDPFGTESSALRLAHYYRRKKRGDDLQRVLRLYTDAWIRISSEAWPMLGATWLEKVHKVLLDFGRKQDADALEVRLRKLAGRSHENMATIRHSVQFTQEEVDEFLNATTAGDLHTTLARIAVQFLPDPEDAKKQVLDTAEQSPLFSLFTKRIIDWDGRVIADVGSPENDMEGQVAHEIGESMGFWVPFLRATIEKMGEKYAVSPDDILDFLYLSPALTEDRRDLIRAGVDAYLNGQCALAVHILVPQIEGAVRNLVGGLGGPVLERGRHGGMNLRNLDKLLRDERLTAALTDRVSVYLRVLFTDQRGWNARNNICHGLLPGAQIGTPIADRVFHALLLLGALREGTPAPDEEKGSGS